MTDTKFVKQEKQWGQSRQFLEQEQPCLKKKKKRYLIETRHKDSKSGRNQKEKDQATEKLKVRKEKPLHYQSNNKKKSQIKNAYQW